MRLLLIVIAGAAIGMAGCSTGLTQMQDTAAKFDQGAHSTGVAQMAFSIKCRRLNAAEISMYKHSPLRLQKKTQRHISTLRFRSTSRLPVPLMN